MSYRRSGVNYILWALYGLTVCAALTRQAESVCLLFGWEEVQWCLLAAAGCICLLFLVLFLPAHLLAGRWGRTEKEKRGKKSRSGRKAAEGLYLILLIAVSLSLRLLTGEAAAAGAQGAESTLTAFSGFPFASLTFSSLYAWLKLILSAWAGAGIVAAVFLPPLYETLGVLLFYPALRSLAGRLPAVTVTAVLAFLPVLPGRDAAGGADGFFLTAAAILLLLSSRYVESLSMEPFTPKSWPVWAAFCGLLTGAAVFLDSAFFSLLIFPIWAALFVLPAKGAVQSGRREKAGAESGKGRRSSSGQVKNGKRRAAGIAVLLLAAVLGYAAILTVQVWLSGEEVLTVLVEKYGIWKGAFGRFSPAFPENEVFWLIPVVCLCILYIFGFFDQRGNVGSIWLPSFLFSTVLYLLVQYGGAERALALLCWLIMAGMGLHSVFCPETGRKESREKKEEADIPASSALQKEDEFTPGKLLTGDIPSGAVLPGEPLPNPLPVPKRHEHREMDYAFEPGEDEMFFDIDRVEEGDDFDYQ